jgi:tryptophan synthase alpha subunit
VGRPHPPRAHANTDVPVAVGFGIGTPQQAREAAEAGADGVIIGSRLIRAAGESEQPAAGVQALVAQFAAGLTDLPAGEPAP